jgi:hypothetical protein
MGRSFFSTDNKGVYMTVVFKAPEEDAFLRITAISAVCAVLHTEYSALSAVLLAAAIVFIKLMLGTKFKKSRKKENRYEKK